MLGLNAGVFIYLFYDAPKKGMPLKWVFSVFATVLDTMTSLALGFLAGVIITAVVASILAIAWVMYKVAKPAWRFFVDFMLARDVETEKGKKK
ncbi:MAG: hypothetical protein Q8L28_00365 [bacterium]|nr:hypothetical protein [bacterium]